MRCHHQLAFFSSSSKSRLRSPPLKSRRWTAGAAAVSSGRNRKESAALAAASTQVVSSCAEGSPSTLRPLPLSLSGRIPSANGEPSGSETDSLRTRADPQARPSVDHTRWLSTRTSPAIVPRVPQPWRSSVSISVRYLSLSLPPPRFTPTDTPYCFGRRRASLPPLADEFRAATTRPTAALAAHCASSARVTTASPSPGNLNCVIAQAGRGGVDVLLNGASKRQVRPYSIRTHAHASPTTQGPRHRAQWPRQWPQTRQAGWRGCNLRTAREPRGSLPAARRRISRPIGSASPRPPSSNDLRGPLQRNFSKARGEQSAVWQEAASYGLVGSRGRYQTRVVPVLVRPASAESWRDAAAWALPCLAVGEPSIDGPDM